MLPPPTNTKSKRDSRCLHNSAGVIKTREAVQCACKDPIEQRWEPNQFGNSIPLFSSSFLSQSSFLCLCWHLGGGRCIRGDRCGPSRHLRREWRCRQLLMASSNLQKLISTHPRAAHLLSVILSSSSSSPQKKFSS